ncbi:UDP-glycosyltransferase [Arachis hypogaea]|nr:UDP-glycosyltransferase [Arachis hypogaea]
MVPSGEGANAPCGGLLCKPLRVELNPGSVTAGIPIVALPNWLDQPTNAKLVEDVFKTGVRMRLGEEDGVASAEEVERSITEVMEGPMAEEIKMRAVGLKEAARKAMVDGGSSDRNINRFVTEISGKFT